MNTNIELCWIGSRRLRNELNSITFYSLFMDREKTRDDDTYEW
jgi:hypothetical protein